MNKEEYLQKFSSEDKAEINSKHVEAFKLAIETRKFEIELYWKRATYFWAFIAVTFVGYGLTQRLPVSERGFLEFFLSCFGFILSLGWFFANRGSKQWQENWEHHVDHLEDKVTGPLYKLVLRRGPPQSILEWIEFIITGPSKHSVSKINQLISLYITLMWLVLIYNSQDSWQISNWSIVDKAVLLLTFLAVIGIVLGARTYIGNIGHTIDERESSIIDKKTNN